MTGKLSVKVEAFKPIRSNALFGFADLLIPEIRLKIKAVAILQSHDRRWAALPAKPQLNKDGCAIVDDRGKRQYTNVLQFADRTKSDAFSERVIAALIEQFPHAFDDGAAS
jgi:hypothetical protein